MGVLFLVARSTVRAARGLTLCRTKVSATIAPVTSVAWCTMAAWQLLTELARRNRDRWIMEAHPGGGQYDCLWLARAHPL